MITAGDCLAGGGGVTRALTQIQGVEVKWVLNHDQIAIRTNMFNNKGIKHFWADMYKQDVKEMEPVDFIWFSIECTQHSPANGGREKKIGSYMLGWECKRYIEYHLPYIVGIENVPEFKKWAPIKNGKPDKSKLRQEFERWKNSICELGYDYHECICNAADFGIPTRRVRYFAFFIRKELGIIPKWPKQTHDKLGRYGLEKWVPCKKYIDLENEGESIFGREFNENIRKGKRVKLSENTLRRIAGGIKKYAPELYFIMHYYGNGTQFQSLNNPLNTIPTKDRHALITLEKLQFVQDHCHTDNFNLLNEPLNPILTRQQKQLVTLEKKQFIADYYGRNNTAHDLNGPANTITCENSKHIITTQFLTKYYNDKRKNGKIQNHSTSVELPLPTITTVSRTPLISIQFISKQYNSNGKPEANNQSIDEPLGTFTTQEKSQFISTFFNSNGKPESQNQDLNNPLGSILTGTNKKALITAIENGEFDFDIKMRFLEPEELARISTFPERYFTHPLLKLTKKEQTRLIGNAVPPAWAKLIIEPVIKELSKVLEMQKMAV